MDWFTKGKLQCCVLGEQLGVWLHFSALYSLPWVGFVLGMVSIEVTR